MMGDRVVPPNRTAPSDATDVARTLDVLATAVMILVTIGILYFAREILVPVAIAVLLSFVLSPPVKLLRRLGLGKKLAVGVVVLVTFLVAVGLGAILVRQVTDLARNASRYQETLVGKMAGVRSFAAHNAVLAKINSAIADLDPGTPSKTDTPKPAMFPSTPGGERGKMATPAKVEIVQPPPGMLTLLQSTAGAVATPAATAVFVAIFIVFILMQREDLRNRFIRLAGSGDLQRTTLALNDAARRLSRYYLAQVLLNAGFGVVTAIVLTVIGVPGAILWGIVASFMRFIPYVGSFGAALLPVTLSLAASPGWAMAIETAVFFAAFEFLVGQVVEPLVYGHHTGISPFAVVLSATFWTWLWGPIGLVLSTPLTVCMVVMGRHVERLTFLAVLLGDAPPLTDVESFYQRMLSGDASEVFEHCERYLETHSLLAYCDAVALRALLMAQADVRRGALSEERQRRVRDTMRDLVETLADLGETATDHAGEPPAPASLGSDDDGAAPHDPEDNLPRTVALDASWTRDGAILCVAARSALDEAAAQLLADLLRLRGFGVAVETADHVGKPRQDDDRPRLVFLSLLDADQSVAQARFAIRRLRRRLPETPLAAAFWRYTPEPGHATARGDVRADAVVATFAEAIRLCLERGARTASPGEGDHEPAPGGSAPDETSLRRAG